MRHLHLFASAATAIAISACSTTSTPDPVVNTPGGAAAALNTTLGPVSFGNPANFSAVDEDFPGISTSLTVASNGSGFEYTDQTLGEFSNPDTISFDSVTNTLTLDVQQGDIDIQDTFGPIVLANPGDFSNLENDALAVLIAAFPHEFPTPAQAGVPGVDFDPDSFFGDRSGADAAIIALRETGGADITVYLEALNAAAASRLARDFFSYTGANGTRYYQLKMSGTNSGIGTNYVSLGVWVAPPATGFPGDDAYGATVWGKRTPNNEVPETGTATYNTSLVGFVLRQNRIEELRGGVFLNVNFGASTVSASVDADLVVTDVNGAGTFVDLATLSGNGFLETGNRFDGTLQGDNDPSLRGEFEGAFFGPGATEVGGALTFSNNDMAGSGGFVGVRNDSN